jgi:hypothetical protein
VAEHLGTAPPKPTEIDAELAPGWDPLIARLLAKDPAERFESVNEVRRALLALELGNKGQKPLVLPRARASARRQAVPAPNDSPEPEAEDESPADERYRFETPLRTGETSTLTRAVDTVLGRSVIIERFEPALDATAEKRLFGLARCGSPFVQRALAYDRQSSVAVFEAPNGAPLTDAFPEPPSPLISARLLKRLGQALAPLHALGHCHGALSTSTVVVDDHGFPTILISGLPPATTSSADDDTRAAIVLVAAIAGVEPSWPTLVAALAGRRADDDAIAMLATNEPHSGADLFAAGSRLEIAASSEP